MGASRQPNLFSVCLSPIEDKLCLLGKGISRVPLEFNTSTNTLPSPLEFPCFSLRIDCSWDIWSQSIKSSKERYLLGQNKTCEFLLHLFFLTSEEQNFFRRSVFDTLSVPNKQNKTTTKKQTKNKQTNKQKQKNKISGTPSDTGGYKHKTEPINNFFIKINVFCLLLVRTCVPECAWNGGYTATWEGWGNPFWGCTYDWVDEVEFCLNNWWIYLPVWPRVLQCLEQVF